MPAIDRVPNEIWIVILGLAADCPELDSESENTFHFGASAIESHSLLRKAEKTMRRRFALALTTRLWLGPALELLYEVVVLETESAAQYFRSSVAENSATSPLIRRTRHLFTTPLALPYFSPILGGMLSLTTFAINDPINGHGKRTRKPFSSATDALHALIQTCGSSIKRLQLPGTFCHGLVEDILASTPNIRTLVLSHYPRDSGVRPPRLAHLKSLALASVDDILISGDDTSVLGALYPTLTHLALSTMPKDALIHIHPFWRVQGYALTALTLVVPHGVPTTRTSLFSTVCALHLATPALQRLQLVLDWDHDIIALLTVLPPRVQRLALHVATLPSSNEDVDFTHTPCFDVLCSLEALKCTAVAVGHKVAAEVGVVQFTSPEHVEHMKEAIERQGGRGRFWATQGLFSVEDHDGQPL